MNNNNNKGIIWGVLVLAIIVLGIVFYMKSKEPAVEVEQQSQTPATTQSNNVSTTKPASTTSNTGNKPVSMAYEDALVKYKDRRIQLNTACQANPNVVTYKDNTGIMIDNRSDKTRIVKVGSSYTIKPWGFQIVVLPDIYLKSKTLLVDCDKSQNVATILVQE